MTTAIDSDHLLSYFAEKGRDLPQALSPVADLLEQLDSATIAALNCGGEWSVVNQAFEAVLSHPGNTYTREVLSYRQRQLHFK